MVSEEIYGNYMRQLMAGNRSECIRIINKLIKENISVKDLYERMFQRSMYDVGTLWETNKISIGAEHMCTSITEGLISLTHPLHFTTEHSGKKVVVTCTPGENHQVGARIVSDYFELNGWNSYFLGPNTPYIILADFIEEKKPDLLAVSMSINANLDSVTRLVKNLTKKFPDLKIIVGGQGFASEGESIFESLPMVEIIKSLGELDNKVFNKK